MLVLGIETSGLGGEIALLQDGEVVSVCSLTRHGRRHAQSLVQEVNDAIAEQDCRPNDVDVVGVSIGPGSFTGLRVGVVFAKTWCYATGSRLVAVDTMQAIAENTPREIVHATVIADAQRGGLFVGNYQRNENGVFEQTKPIAVVPAAQFIEQCTDADFVTGPGVSRCESAITDCCRIAEPQIRIPRANVIAAIASRHAEAGKFADPWTLEPFYLRKSAAEEKAEQSG